MSLTADLKAKMEATVAMVPKEKLDIMLGATQDLIDQKTASKALKVGDKFPSFSLSDANGKKVAGQDVQGEKGTVVSFYRGGWCPYCNLELAALQSNLDEIKSNGFDLVAITPETPDNSLTTSEKHDLKFTVLSDIDNKLAKEAGLVIKLPEPVQSIYSEFGLDVAKHNGNQDFELPMPATYVVNSAGEIIHSFVSEDYTARLDPEDILKVISKA